MKKILLLIILHAFALNTGVQAISIHKDNPHMQKSKLTKPACSYEDKFCKNSSAKVKKRLKNTDFYEKNMFFLKKNLKD